MTSKAFELKLFQMFCYLLLLSAYLMEPSSDKATLDLITSAHDFTNNNLHMCCVISFLGPKELRGRGRGLAGSKNVLWSHQGRM